MEFAFQVLASQESLQDIEQDSRAYPYRSRLVPLLGRVQHYQPGIA
jgi:hypothetical protein